jgi:hypothetical protein
MFKVFYGLPNDIIDRTSGNIGIIDVLQANKVNILTEPSQMKGEKIDMAYIVYSEALLSQIGELNIKKISIISKHSDDIIVPKNFTKYSSDIMETPHGTFYNIILNHKTYKTEVEIIIHGIDDPHQDVVRNIYALYGNVITSTYNKCIDEAITNRVKSCNLPNPSGIYYNVLSMIEGINKCEIKKYVIKVRTDGHVSDLSPIITLLQTPMSDDKIITINTYVPKVSQLRYSICDHIIAGKFENVRTMYVNALGILNNRIAEMRKKLKLEYTPEQILVVGYLKDKLNYVGSNKLDIVKQTMIKYFHIVNIDELGHYMIPSGKRYLISGKNIDKEMYKKICTVKSIEDI